MGITLALHLNSEFLKLGLDLKNAHTFSSRDRNEEELESDVIYHYLLEVFRSLYGKTVTPQWHYEDGPDRPPHHLPHVHRWPQTGRRPSHNLL